MTIPIQQRAILFVPIIIVLKGGVEDEHPQRGIEKFRLMALLGVVTVEQVELVPAKQNAGEGRPSGIIGLSLGPIEDNALRRIPDYPGRTLIAVAIKSYGGVTSVTLTATDWPAFTSTGWPRLSVQFCQGVV